MTDRDTDGRQERETDRRRERRTDRQTMADVSHANPFTGDTLGEVFRRGPAVADGGNAAAPEARTEGREERDDDATNASHDYRRGRRTMGAIDHTPPHEEVNDVWSRGYRGSEAGFDVQGDD